MSTTIADTDPYCRPSTASLNEQPGTQDGVHLNTSTLEPQSPRQLPSKIPFYRTRYGRIIIVLIFIILILIGVVGGVGGGTRTSAVQLERDTGPTASQATITTTNTTTITSTATIPSTATITTTLSAPSPTQSNCIWEGTAPFCDGKCHTGFTQVEEDNCGSGDCCATGFKVLCCPA